MRRASILKIVFLGLLMNETCYKTGRVYSWWDPPLRTNSLVLTDSHTLSIWTCEQSSWKNQVRPSGFLVYFELDFYCLCSLKKSIWKLIFFRLKIQFVELDFSRIKYRWIGYLFYKYPFLEIITLYWTKYECCVLH